MRGGPVTKTFYRPFLLNWTRKPVKVHLIVQYHVLPGEALVSNCTLTSELIEDVGWDIYNVSK